MLVYVNTKSLFHHTAMEPLFLNPDGIRTRFPIGWGGGRYDQGSLKIYKNGIPLNKNSYTEEDNGVFFNFKTAPEEGLYTDYTIRFNIREEDYAFSQGTSDSAYPGEEYFLFPNWNNAKGCGDAFWIGKYTASNENGVPVSKKGKSSWVNTRWDTQVASCLTKGNGFHCIRNREWVSIALWTEKMGINVKGNINGYNNQSDIDGDGTAITSSMNDGTDTNHKILTGTGPATFRHNGRINGISDLVGNIGEAVDGLQLRDGVPYILDEDNENYIALASTDIVKPVDRPSVINYINNSTNDLLNEGLPVDDSNAFPITINKDEYWKPYNDAYSGTKICYRGSGNVGGNATGVWSLYLAYDVSISDWSVGLRLARNL